MLDWLICHYIGSSINNRKTISIFYILTNVCSQLYNNSNKSNILSRERGAHIMERKKDSNEKRDYRKKILNLLGKIENQDQLERIYTYMKHVYIHFTK